MISTVSMDQTEILRNIMMLHNYEEPFHADLTYGKGNFWQELDQPAIRVDIQNKDSKELTTVADVRALPFSNETIRSVVFDPPFIHAHGNDSIIGNRFSSYPSQKLLRKMYEDALEEIHRVLIPSGILVFKCQDIVESGRQNWTHISVFQMAAAVGLLAIDLFILTVTHRIQGHNHTRQQHARKFHSYFWVFRKC